jgi:hypothetical protein
LPKLVLPQKEKSTSEIIPNKPYFTLMNFGKKCPNSQQTNYGNNTSTISNNSMIIATNRIVSDWGVILGV